MSEHTALARSEAPAGNGGLPARAASHDPWQNLTLPETLQLGEVLAASGYFQDARGAAQAVVKILYGRELGVPPVSSLMGIHVINGRPSPSAGLIATVIKRSRKYDYRVQRWDNEACELEFYERRGAGWELLGPSPYTLQDAQTAGLANGPNSGNWKKHPRNMLFARALTNGARLYCADVFGGSVYVPEEMGVLVDGETGEPLRLQMPEVETELGERLSERVAGATEKHDTYGEVAIKPLTPDRAEDLPALQALLLEVFLQECQGGAAREALDTLALRDYVGRTLGDRDPILGKLDAAQLREAIAETRALPKLRARGHALYAEAGGDTGDGAAMRADLARVLGRPVETRRTIAAREWHQWIAHLEAQQAEPAAEPETASEYPEGDPFQDE